MSGFKKNPIIETKIAKTSKVQAVLQLATHAAEVQAKADAPVKTGAYRDGIKGEVALGPKGTWVGRLVGYDFKTHWIEFGTATGFAARGTLRQACEKVGLKVRSVR